MRERKVMLTIICQRLCCMECRIWGQHLQRFQGIPTFLKQTMAYVQQIILLLSFLVLTNLWYNVRAKSGGEITADPKLRLCGEEILAVHKAYCEQKHKRDLRDDGHADNLRFIKEELALSFLQKNSRQKRSLRLWYSNADEECCKEKCSIEEVAEYNCN